MEHNNTNQTNKPALGREYMTVQTDKDATANLPSTCLPETVDVITGGHIRYDNQIWGPSTVFTEEHQIGVMHVSPEMLAALDAALFRAKLAEAVLEFDYNFPFPILKTKQDLKDYDKNLEEAIRKGGPDNPQGSVVILGSSNDMIDEAHGPYIRYGKYLYTYHVMKVLKCCVAFYTSVLFEKIHYREGGRGAAEEEKKIEGQGGGTRAELINFITPEKFWDESLFEMMKNCSELELQGVFYHLKHVIMKTDVKAWVHFGTNLYKMGPNYVELFHNWSSLSGHVGEDFKNTQNKKSGGFFQRFLDGTTAAMVESMKSQLLHAFGSLKTTLGKNAHIILKEIIQFSIALLAIARSPSFEMVAYISALYISGSRIASGALSSLAGLLVSNFQSMWQSVKSTDVNDPKNTKIEGHVGESKQPSDEEVHTALGLLLPIFQGLLKKKTVEEQRTLKSQIGVFRAAYGFIKDIASAIKFLSTYLLLCLDFAWEAITGQPYVPVQLKMVMKRIHGVLEKGQKLVDSSEKTLNDPLVRSDMNAIQQEVSAIMLELVKHPMKEHYCLTPFFSFVRSWEPLYRMYKLYEITKGGRVQPVWVNYFGPTKQGKTTCVALTVARVMALLGLEPNLGEIYPRNEDEKFWSGYHGQFCAFMDELFQMKAQEYRATLAQTIMHILNINVFPLDMANVEDKGNTQFVSPLFVTTSNAMRIPSDLLIESIDALKRRLTFALKVTLKEGSDRDHINPDNWLFALHDADGKQLCHPETKRPIVWNFYEQARMIAEAIKKNKDAHLEYQVLIRELSQNVATIDKLEKEQTEHEKVYKVSWKDNKPVMPPPPELRTKQTSEVSVINYSSRKDNNNNNNDKTPMEAEGHCGVCGEVQDASWSNFATYANLIYEQQAIKFAKASLRCKLDDLPEPEIFLQHAVMNVAWETSKGTPKRMNVNRAFMNLLADCDPPTREQIASMAFVTIAHSGNIPFRGAWSAQRHTNWLEDQIGDFPPYMHEYFDNVNHLGHYFPAIAEETPTFVRYGSLKSDWTEWFHGLAKETAKTDWKIMSWMSSKLPKNNWLFDEIRAAFNALGKSVLSSEWSDIAVIVANVATGLSVLFGIVGVCVLGYEFFKTKPAQETPEDQSGVMRVNREDGATVRRGPVRKGPPTFTKVKGNSGMDENAEAMIQHAKGNFGVIKFKGVKYENENGTVVQDTYFANFTGALQRVFVTAAHIFNPWDKESDFTIYRDGKEYTIPKNKIVLEFDHTRDLVFGEIMLNNFPAFKDISDKFLSEEDLQFYIDQAIMVGVSNSINTDLEKTLLTKAEFADSITYSVDGQKRTTSFIVVAIGSAIKGWCGRLWVVNNPKLVHKFLGIHVAGGDGKVYCAILMKEDFASWKTQAQGGLEPLFPIPEHMTSMVVEIVPKSSMTRLPIGCKIRKTPAFGRVGAVTTVPVEMRPYKDAEGRLVSPAAMALKKFNVPKIDEDAIGKLLVHHVARQLITMEVKNYLGPWRILTDEEMYNGVKGFKFIHKSIDLTAGISLDLEKTIRELYPGEKPSRAHLFTQESVIAHRKNGAPLVPKPWFAAKVAECERAMLKIDTAIEWLKSHTSKMNLKKERRKPGREPRIYDSLPVELLCVCRKYFAFYLENAMRGCLESYIACGISPQNVNETTQLLNWITYHAFCEGEDLDFGWIAGDCTNLDSTDRKFEEEHFSIHVSELFTKFGDAEVISSIPQSMVRGEPVLVPIYNMVCHITLMPIQLGNVVFLVLFGMRSGIFHTATIQCFIMKLNTKETVLEEYCHQNTGHSFDYCFANKPQAALSAIEMAKTERLSFTGDDNVGRPHKELAKYLTMRTMQKWFARNGKIYTDAYKRSDIPDFYPRSEVTYLKRKIVREGFLWKMPLLETTIIDMVSWGEPSRYQSLNQAMWNNMDMALQEWAIHGREQYQHWLKVYQVILEDIGYHQLTRSYAECVLLQGIYQRDTTEIVGHMGKDPEKGSIEKEQGSLSAKGVITSSLATATTFLGKVSKGAEYGKQALQSVAKIANLFDFPTTTQAIQYVKTTSPRFVHSAGQWLGLKLAMDNQNAISAAPRDFASDVDYNSLLNCAMTPMLVKVLTVTTSSTVGDVIDTIPVSPLFCGVTTVAMKNTYWVTHQGSVALLGSYWRGSMRYMLMCFATGFDNFRLGCYWEPDASLNVTTVDVNEVGNVITKIFDTSGDTQIRFTIPYLQRQEWQPTRDLAVMNSLPIVGKDGANGQLVFYIISPLSTGSATVPTTVDIAVFQAAGADFEVAQPTFLDTQRYESGIDTMLEKDKEKRKKDLTICGDVESNPGWPMYQDVGVCNWHGEEDCALCGGVWADYVQQLTKQGHKKIAEASLWRRMEIPSEMVFASQRTPGCMHSSRKKCRSCAFKHKRLDIALTLHQNFGPNCEKWTSHILSFIVAFFVCYLMMSLLMRMLPVAAALPIGHMGKEGIEEKQPVTDPMVTQPQGLMTIDDNVGTSDPSADIQANVAVPLTMANPYTHSELLEFLQRKYLVKQYTWAGAAAFGSTVGIGSFPDLLSSLPNIDAKLQYYQFFRAGVEVEFRLNTTTFNKGALLVAWVPHYNAPTLQQNPFQSIYAASGNNCVILSAYSNVTARFTIPYVAPSRYWDMSDSAAEAAYGWFGYFQIFVLSALQIVGAAVSPDVQVSVYAHFVEPEVAGPNFRTTVANIEGHVGKELTIVVNLREAFKTGDFPALIPAKKVVHEGFEMGEKLTTWTNYFHRFRIAQVGRTIASMNPMLLSVFHYKDVTVYPLGQLSRYMVQFLFYRGSQRWMLAKSSVASSISIYATNVDRLTIDLNTFIGGDNGMHNIIEGKVLEPVEVPYYCRYPLWSDQFTQEYLQEAAAASTEDTAPHVAFTPGFTSADTSTYDVYVALGDDWSSGWLLPPMCLTDASANANALKRSMKSVSVATDANKPAPFEKASSKSAVLLTTSSVRRVVDMDNNNNSVSREKRLLNRKM